MRISHNIYYLIELLILTGGFYIVFLLGYSVRLQLAGLIAILLIYTTSGILHHKVHHNLHKKIMIEYILISLVILSIFIFLNVGRL